MERGTFSTVWRKWDKRITAAKDSLTVLETNRDKELGKLQEQCLLQHGSHEDDSGFMHGCCTRCGAFLG